MKTVHQVTKLTGVSARALQYYDEIGLLHPSALTDVGYRLYDDAALQKLQQILFFKELGFRLKEINEFISKPDFDQISAYKKQKELLLLKRNRTDRLIQLLSRLEKGERVVSFKEFDLSDYISALEDFKKNSTEAIIKYWGSIENFDLFIQKIRDDEANVAKLAITEFGSVEKYTEAMKYNLEHFTEIMEQQMSGDAKEIGEQIDTLYAKLVSDRTKDISSSDIQNIVSEIDDFLHKHASVNLVGNSYWATIIDAYKSDYIKNVTDAKYGLGATEYIIKAFQYFVDNIQE